MKRTKIYLVALALTLVLSAGVLIHGGWPLQAPPTGTWAPTLSPMAAARARASAVLLSDGRVLITGGTGVAGSLASAEFLNANGTFSAAPSMQFARAGHSSTVLADGRVLVAGGTGASGTPTDTAEIFNPLSGAWSISPPLMVGRSGHTATVLVDGRILFAGGLAAGGPTASLEIYDPGSGAFSLAPSSLLTPRKNHAAARLSDGRVLIVGGSNGTNPLASSDIFDPSNGSVAAGPVMGKARSGLSATTLLDGTVLVAGGTTTVSAGIPPVPTQQDTPSAELLNASATAFSAAPSGLPQPRSGQLAFLLPHNNAVLIVGGTSNGTTLSSSELYMPWTGAFSATGSMSSPRSGASGAALSQDGTLLVAGGLDATGAALPNSEVYGFATVKTDLPDYAPGQIVTITGSGWKPGETVTLGFLESPYYDSHPSVTAVADANGNIFNNQFSPDINDSAILFYLTATGSVSLAQTTFHDTNTTTTQVSCSPNPIHFGSPAICTGLVTSSTGSIDNGIVTWTTPPGIFSAASGSVFSAGPPPQCTLARTGLANQTGCSVTFNPQSLGPLTITANFFASNNGHLTSIGTQTTTLIVTAGFTAPNYSIVYGTNTVTLSGALSYPASLGTPTGTVTATGNGFSGSGTLSGGVFSIILTGTGTLPVSGSPYPITYNYSGDSIYAGSSDSSTTLTVTPAPLTITANDKSRVYGTANPTFDATYSGFANGQGPSALNGTLSCTTTAISSSPAGKYSINCSGQSSTNYAITYVAGTLTISSVPLTITASNGTMIYGGTVPTITPGFSGFINGDTAVNLTTQPVCITAATKTSAPGSYSSSCSGAVDANYTINYVPGTVTVSAATLTITASSGSFNYGGTVPAITPIYSGFVNGDTSASLTTQPTCSTTATSTSPLSGSPYASTCSGAVDSNYTISYKPGTVTESGATLSITADDKSKAYGQIFTSFTDTVVGAVNGDTFTVPMSSTGAPAAAGVASYPIVIGTVTGANLGNYTLTTHNGTLTVNALALSITADDKSKTYGQIFTAFTDTVVGAVNGDTFTVPMSSTGAPAAAGVASYPIVIGTVTGANLGNYTLTTHNGTLTVNALALSITADDKSKAYGQIFTSFTDTVVGAVNGDTFTVPMSSTGAPAAAGVASYPIVIGTVTGANLGNYTLTTHNGTLTVNALALSITADDKSKAYGQIFTAFTDTVVGAVNGDTFTVPMSSTGAPAAAGVASYPIVIGTVTGANLGNYTLTTHNGTLTVNALALSITADDKSKAYGQIFTAFTDTVVGAVNGDTFTVPMSSTGAPAAAGVASYPIVIGTVTGANLGNYTLTTHNGTLTVNASPLTITASSGTMTYGGTVPTIIPNITGYKNGDTNLTTPPTCSTTATRSSPASPPTYTSSCSGAADSDYTITYVDGSVTVTQVVLTVTTNPASKPYGQPNPAFSVSYSGWVGTEGPSVLGGTLTFATSATQSSNVGTYPVTPGGLTSTNYTIKFVAGPLTINPLPLAPHFTANNKMYDGTTAATIATRTLSGTVINGDVVSLSGGTATFAFASVGTWTVTGGSFSLAGAAAGNYYLSPTTAQTTASITPAPLTITADNKSRQFGLPNPPLTVSYSGFVHGETASVLGGTLTCLTTATIASNVGAYPITCSGQTSTNYTIVYVPGTLFVTPLVTYVGVTLSSCLPNLSPCTQQYSDLVTFTATVTPANVNGIAPATQATFWVCKSSVAVCPTPTPGTTPDTTIYLNMGTAPLVVDSSNSNQLIATLKNTALPGPEAGVALLEPVNPAPGTPPGTPNGYVSPGSHAVTALASFSGVNSNFSVANTPAPLTITPEDARAYYSGLTYYGVPVGTPSVTIPLSANVFDISNPMFAPAPGSLTADSAYDPYPGDIRNATVTFVNRDAGNAVLCKAPSVVLIDPSVTTAGSAACNFTVNIPTSGDLELRVGIVVGDYYTYNNSNADTIVEIGYQGTGFITGGGYLLLTNAATGQLRPTPGLKNNFGFNVKYNKTANTLQGSLNTIVRSKYDLNGNLCSVSHPGFTTCVYQVKSNSGKAGTTMTFLNVFVSPTAPNPPSSAQFQGHATVQDVTNPRVASIGIDGGVIFSVTMTDFGAPNGPSNSGVDTIGFTVTASPQKGGFLWYSSNFTTKTNEQQLAGGNLTIH